MKGKGFHLQHATPLHTLCSSRMQGEGYTVVPFPFPVHRVTTLPPLTVPLPLWLEPERETLGETVRESVPAFPKLY